MFKELEPLVAERSLHLLIAAAKDGMVNLYIEPTKKADAEDDAFVTPIRLLATPEELDRELPAILTEWVSARTRVTQSLREALDAANQQMAAAAEAAKKAAADKVTKKGAAPAKAGTKGAVAATATLSVKPPPSLLADEDDAGDDAPVSDATAGASADPNGASPAAPLAENQRAAPIASVQMNEGPTGELF